MAAADNSNQAHEADTDTAVGAEKLAYRRKVCVVGANGWGKTSLVRSLVACAPSLADESPRTLGVDLHTLTFEQEETETSTTHFELTLWDFGGQDVYQSAHSLFFSKQSLYLLCVDTSAYEKMLDEADAMAPLQGEAHRTRFMTKSIFSWLWLIYSRDPCAEVMVVGTKCDLVETDRALQAIGRDLRLQLGEWKRRYLQEIEVELRAAEEHALASVAPRPRVVTLRASHMSRYSGNAHHIESFEELREKISAISFDQWLVVSCKDQNSIEETRQAIETKVAASDSNVDMSGHYAQVLEVIRARREAGKKLEDAKRRVESCVVPQRSLLSHLVRAIDGVDHDGGSEALRVLHHLGEIVWFEHENAGPLNNVVILDVRFVISLIREAVNHESSKMAGDGSIAHFEEGRVSHEMLETFPTWRDFKDDEELNLAFKTLLVFFQLAYPANEEELDWNSDLIVPSYWKVRKPAVDKSLLQQKTMMARKGVVPVANVIWEYELPSEVSETIFEQFAVQSNTSLFKRQVWPNCIESFVEGDFASRIALSPSDKMRDVLCVEVAVEDPAVGWQYLRYYAMTLEKVLDNYPGLSVARYIVDGAGERHRLSVATKALEDTVRRGQDEEQIRRQMPWLPPDLNWFMEKAWRHPGKLQQLQMREIVKQTVHRLDVLQKLVVAGDTERRYPALWTLEYNGEEKMLALKMLSDLSGQCFHEPLTMEVPAQFLAKHGSWLQTGLWVCSNVVPEVISMGILQKVVDLASPIINKQVDRASAVHNLIENLDLQAPGGFNSRANQKLSPRGTMALLRDILKIHNGDFDELTICDLSNLQCAATQDGHYIWAHRHEIMSMGDQLTPCDQEEFKLSSVLQSGPTPATTPQGSYSSLVASPTNTPPSSPKASSPTNNNSPTSPISNNSPSSPTTTAMSDGSFKLSTWPLNLQFESASGLSEWDWRRTYCKWQLLYRDSSMPLASGVTGQHTSLDGEPDWTCFPGFAINCISSLDMLRECRIAIRLKRPSRFVVTTKLLGEGSIWLRDFIAADTDIQTFTSRSIEIKLQGSSQRSVKCSLNAM